MSNDINTILKVYLGAGSEGGYNPTRHEERMTEAFGDRSEDLASQIDKYLAFNYKPDWEGKGLQELADEFVERIRKAYPELNKVSARALANRFTYQWR